MLMQKGNDNSNKKKLKRLQSPLSPSDFDGLTYPRVIPHFFFIKMTTKDVKEITLDHSL